MTNKILRTLAATLLLVISSPSMAGPCDAYYSFDDTLADASPNAYDGEMFGAKGAPATPVFSEGKFGQALMLDGTAAMRALLDLNYDLCPQVTISAWIKLARDAPGDNNLHLLSTGGGASPGLVISGTGLHLLGTENGILKPNVIRKDSWLFVAGVYDYLTGEYALYSGGSVPVPGVLSQSRSEPQNAFWVGTVHDDWGTFAGGIAIDDLKITGRFLTSDQVTTLRNASPAPNGQQPAAAAEPAPIASTLSSCDVQADCATGTYCAFDNSCHPDSHMPKRALELTVLEGDPGIDASNVILGEGARSETELSVSDLGEDYFYGDWCFHPDSALPYGMDQIRSFNFAATKTGPASYPLAYEFRDSPGVTGGTGFWAWGVDVTDRLIVVWAFENSGETIQDLKVTRATQQRFFTDFEQDSGKATFVRGQCNTSENFAPESIQANYFVGPWCITESTIPNEPSKPNWRYLFHNSGSMSRNPGDGHDYAWSWQQENEKLGLSDNGITTTRTVQSVTSDSFTWGLDQSRTYTRGACPTQAANSGPDITAGPQPDGQGGSADEPVNPHIRPGPNGEPTLTALAGVEGSDHQTVVLQNGFISKIRWWQDSERPCSISVDGWQPADDADGFENNTEAFTVDTNCSRLPSISLTNPTSAHAVGLDRENESAIGRMEVCMNNPPIGSIYHRIKGIRIWGNAINDDGSTTSLSNGASEELPNCHSWSSIVACGSGEFATGLRVHTTSAIGERRQITGLQLICRDISAPGDVQ